MPKIIKTIVPRPAPEKPKRVAAYARVSSGKDAMLHSLSAQVNYYNEMIRSHPGWLYCGVYSDEGLTGTRANRPGFQKMLEACRSGSLDLILTKSISRFARNTVTLLETVRELKHLSVDVYFEEQNIHTISTDGELLISILSSYAQEESLSASENQKWRVKRNFENGKPWNVTMLGYRFIDRVLTIEPEEAETVRFIFGSFLEGHGRQWIANELNRREIPTRLGNGWNQSSVASVLGNYAYTGNLLLQTTFRENHITKAKRFNTGELPRFHVEGAHEAIIPMEMFDAVRAEIEHRAERYPHKSTVEQALRGRVICGICGKHCRHKVSGGTPSWICATFTRYGKSSCPAKAVPERVIDGIVSELGGNMRIQRITIHEGESACISA